jgi:hypothetical protein
MATKQIMRNAAIWLDAFDLQRGSNRIDIEGTTDAVDATCFADTSRVKLLDTPEAAISASGYTDMSFEQGLYDLWGDQGVAITAATKKLAGELAFVADVNNARFNLGAARGAVQTFTLATSTGVGGFGRGKILHVGSGVSATGNGTVQTIGDITAGFRAIGSLHVTALSGTASPTITVRIESAAVIGFGTPTTRATFTAVVGSGTPPFAGKGETKAIAGPVTDTFWRAAWTITGTSPLFDFAVGLGFEEGY